MDPIKDAFNKVREEMDFLHHEVHLIRQSLLDTQLEISKFSEILIEISKTISKMKEEKKHGTKDINEEKNPPPAQNPTQNPPIQTISKEIPTQNNIPTQETPFRSLKEQNLTLSTGNRGVPTDRQTNQQTDKTSQNSPKIDPESLSRNPPTSQRDIDNAVRILDSLDEIKKEIRLKFKRLTPQEMSVFSMIYQLEEDTGDVDYKSLASNLGLTESSVRDYVGRIISKGIPVDKNKINNKTIKLSVPQNLKKIASLSTILQLRDL